MSTSAIGDKPEVLLIGRLPPNTLTRLQDLFHVQKLVDNPDRERLLAERGPHVKAAITTSFVGFSLDLFDKLTALKLISVFGVGTDSVDVEEARKRGITVTNTPDVLTDDVADLAIALMLMTARQLCQADRYVREGQWPVKGMMPLTRKVTGKRVGIIGLGRIGESIATRAASFSCSIAYHSRREKPDCPYRYFSNPVDLARECDFLVAACPLSPSTKHIVNREVLDALGPKGFLINIARGAVVDEVELVKALVEGRLGGAGLDVFENEPEVPKELMAMDNVVLLPHVASGTEETRSDMGSLAIENVKAFFEDKPLLTPV